MQRLVEAIRDIREKMAAGVFVNEARVSMGVVARILREIGWNTDDPKLVSAEHPIGSRRVDYALMREPFGAVVLIEVKRVGKLQAKGEEQLFGYCAKQGVPLAVLTDGREWHFYYSGGSGTYEQRRFATVNLVEHDEEDCAHRLARHLEFRAVASGEFEADVFADYRTHQNRIAAEKAYPTVLDALVKKADPKFVALFCDEVESRCQVRPDEESVRDFLTTGPSVRSRTEDPPPDLPPKRGEGEGDYWFDLDRRVYRFRSRRERFVGLFRVLAERDPEFLERAAGTIGGQVRPYLSRDRSEVTKGRTWRVEPAQLPGGWWLRCQFHADSMARILRRAVEAAELVWGTDVIVHPD